MSERTINEFLQARKELNKKIGNLVIEFEDTYGCRVTSINPGDLVRLGRVGVAKDTIRRDSLPSVEVEF